MQATLNYITATQNSAVIDRLAETETGWSAILHVLDVMDAAATLKVEIFGSGSGAFTTEQVSLGSFPVTSEIGAALLTSQADDSLLPRYLRVTSTVTPSGALGADPGFAISLTASAHRLGDD